MLRHLLLGDFRVTRYRSGIDLIVEKTVSGVATADLVGMSARYSSYIINIANLSPASDDVNFHIRTGLAGTYAAGGTDYDYSLLVREGTTAGVVDQTVVADSKIAVTSPTLNRGWANEADATGTVTLKIDTPSDAGTYKIIEISAVWSSDTNIPVYCAGIGQRRAAGAIDGIQISFNSGNIASATMQLYGLGQ